MALVPLANIAWDLSRQRRIDPIGGLSLVAILASAAVRLVLNDPRVLMTSARCW